MKLSVVVPIYNVERFLSRCLDSLLRQGMNSDEYEIICVNDGSPDNCAQILAEYEQKHPDIIRVITQENQGLGGARNTGTALAKGEYVTYLDSDDFIIDNAYSYLLEHFCQDKPDVLCYDYLRIYTDGKARQQGDTKPDGEVTFDGDGVDAYNLYPLPFVWSKFYKRAFLEQYNIQSHIVSCQDEVFNFDVFRRHPHTRIVSCNVCRYEFGNENSIQCTTNKKSAMKTMDDMFDNIEYVNEHIESDTQAMKPAGKRAINNFLNTYHKKLSMVLLSWKEWNHYHQKLKALPYHLELLDNASVSGKILLSTKRLAGGCYPLHVVLSFTRNIVFLKCIRPCFIKKAKLLCIHHCK